VIQSAPDAADTKHATTGMVASCEKKRLVLTPVLQFRIAEHQPYPQAAKPCSGQICRGAIAFSQ
jgi:hypothetical protein